MTSELLTREVLLDVSVNVVPLLILVVFLAVFVVYAPWGVGRSLASIVQLSLIVLPLAGLALSTFVAAKKIET